MPLSVKRLHTKDQTASEMYRLVNRYAGDLDAFDVDGIPLSRVTLPQFFHAIRSIPYRQDTAGIEVVTRPYIMLTAPCRGWDCKKKAIAIASWLYLHNIPFRFAAVSRRESGEIHHVIVQALIDNEWVDIDATYPHNELFSSEQWTAIEPLAGAGRPVDRAVLVSMSGGGAPRPELTWEYVRAMEQSCPEYLGYGAAEGISAGGIVLIITAAISAATAITIGIIEAVQQRKEREARSATEALQIKTWGEVQESAIAAQVTIEQEQTTQVTTTADTLKKWILPAGVAVAALILLR